MSGKPIVIESGERSRTGVQMGCWPRDGFSCDEVQAIDAPECIARGGLIAFNGYAFASDLMHERIRWHEEWMQ